MMRFSNCAIIVGLLAAALVKGATPDNLPQRVRITTSFDLDWRFLKADANNAEKQDFNDASWRRLNVPHDWSIEGPFDHNNPTGRGGGYLPSGIGWYRKHFTLPANYAQRRVFIEFEGIMANSDVWINGFHLGKRPYGYVSFQYELTGHLNFGEDKSNVLAVRVDNSAQPASRWYTGAGIYRHVRFVVTEPVHIEHWGVFVTTPKVTPEQAVVHAQTTVVNQSDTQREIAVQTTIISPDGQAVQTVETTPQIITAGKSIDFQQDIYVKNPQLWDIDHPNLYRAVNKVIAGKTTLDDELTTFGIREFKFEADTGFWLNGRNMKIKGVCLHHDGGAVGAAVPSGVWERRLEMLSQIGCNAIRSAHNPPAPDFLDLCDRMGFLVMDETFDTWTSRKNNADYGYQIYFRDWWHTDNRDTILRDRNHPCLIIYSVGNEIRDNLNNETGFKTFTAQRDLIHKLDPTRPVTMALFRPNQSRVYDNGFAELLDVVGQNYRENELVAAYKANPKRKVIGTENGHDRQVWLILRDNSFMSGQFLWTGIDYLGEADWPNVANSSGLLDRTGATRPRTYERQSWWSDKPMVHIARRIAPTSATPTDPGYEPIQQRRPQVLFCDWTPKNTDSHEENIEVYSNCEEVELVLNGNSLGSKPRPNDDAPRTWNFSFERGTLKAIGKNKGQVVATYELRTAGKPAKIVLTADRTKLTPNWDDVCYVTAAIVDGNSVQCPWADDLITFKLTGPGAIIAVDNANPASHELFQDSQHHAFQGRCIAVLRATALTGRISLNASSPGLADSTVTIVAVAQTD